MKTRIISLVAAALLTSTTFAAVAQTPAKPQSITLDQALYFCTKAYADFKKTGNTRYLDAGMAVLSPGEQKAVGLVCVGYGTGFEDGWKGRPTV